MTTPDKALRLALDALLQRYVALVNSGDAGNWDCEAEPVVIAARAALSAPPAPQAQPVAWASYYRGAAGIVVGVTKDPSEADRWRREGCIVGELVLRSTDAPQAASARSPSCPTTTKCDAPQGA